MHYEKKRLKKKIPQHDHARSPTQGQIHHRFY